MPAAHRTLAPVLAGVIWAVGSAAGCGQILNSDGLAFVDPPAMPDPNETGVCERGETRCEGVALQICRDDRQGFRTARVCSTPALCCDESACGGAGCKPPVCMPGDFRCEGAVLSTCDEDQAGWIAVDTCGSPAQCNARLGRCTDQPCSPSPPSYQCNGAALEQCTATGWQVVDLCTTPGLCNDSPTNAACSSTGCGSEELPQPFSCQDGDYQRCNDAQSGFELVETCLNATSCLPLIEEVGGDAHQPYLELEDLADLGCAQQVCLPGTYQCREAELFRCNPNRTGFTRAVEIAPCASPGQCNASEGRCMPVSCEEGSQQCSGNQLQVCQSGGWQPVRDCTLAAPCNPTLGCNPGVCEPMEYRCQGAVLERCNASGTGWIELSTCETPALCNAPARRCDRPVCAAEQRRCNRQGQLQQCRLERDGWVTELDCPALAVPPIEPSSALLSGVCDSTNRSCLAQPACSEGLLRCNGAFLERCRGNAWHPESHCGTAALCDPAALQCRPPVCVPGTYQCVMPGTITPVEPGQSTLGLVLQACTPGGDGFVTVRECDAAKYCDAAHGQCDDCVAIQAGCAGNALFQCSADGQERTPDRTCPQGCTDATTNPDLVTGQAACIGVSDPA